MNVALNPLAVRVGIDVGGTFTDFVLFDPRQNHFHFHKQPSVVADPALAVSTGLDALLKKSGLRAADIGLLLHGTTLGLNAIIQRRGARIALVVSRGFRDVLEIGRARMPSSFDFQAGREEPFLPRRQVLEIGARLDPQGRATQWPDAPELDRLAVAIRALEVDSVVLMLINGYAGPAVEAGLTRELAQRLDDTPVLSAATLWPEIREYERTLVAGLNAYIQPMMERYFDRLESLLQGLGVGAPLLVTASNGGLLPLRAAFDRPVDTLLSGPASGVIAALKLAQDTAANDIISFDMGGTSSDIAISQGGEAEIVTRTEIGGFPLVLPVIGVTAIGAGGGSLVTVDQYGIIKVGPQSAGADPGPAAYDRGGTAATVTDCYLACGILQANAFLGGAMKLNQARALQALAAVADRLKFSGSDAGQRAAAGALTVATAQMASQLHKILAQRGLDPSRLTLVPFGGAGPTHANFLAEEAGLAHILIPPKPGTFCAQGAATSDIRRDFVRSLRVSVGSGHLVQIDEVLQALADQARAWFAEHGQRLSADHTLRAALDMRYAGQAYELKIALPALSVAVDALRAAFHEEHSRLYGFADEHATIELSTVRVSLIGRLPELPGAARLDRAAGTKAPAERAVFLGRQWLRAAVFKRDELFPGDRFDGPAIVEQDDTTTVVLPGWRAETDRFGNLHLRPSSADINSGGVQ